MILRESQIWILPRGIAKGKAKARLAATLGALIAGSLAVMVAFPAFAQWDSLLNSGIRILQQQQELEFRREQEERRRQEEERRRQEELQRQERHRQWPPAHSQPAPRQPQSYTHERGSSADPALVAEIQRLLNELDYDAGPVDGAMGSKTREAIRAFQRDSGLSQTGEPSLDIARRLRRGPPPEPRLAEPIFRDRQPAAPDRSQTAEIQRLLNQQGFDAGPVDGLMGARTREAIRAYQTQRGLPVTGEPTADLGRNLRDEAPPSASPLGPGFSGGIASNLAGSGRDPVPAEVPPELTTLRDRMLLAGSRAPDDLRVDADALRRMTARLIAASLPEIIEQSGVRLLDLMQLLEPDERRSMYLDAVQNHDRPLPGARIGEHTLFEQLERQDWFVNPENLPGYGFTPFEQERLVEIFRLRGLPRIVSQSPELPIPALVLCEVPLSGYDRRRQMFDLSREVAACGIRQPPSLIRNVGLSADLPTESFRPEFGIEPGEAEKLFLSLPARHTGENRTVVLAIEALLQGLKGQLSRRSPNAVLQFRTVGAALYADSSLEWEIYRFPATTWPATSGVETPDDPAAVANAEALASRQGKPLVAGRVLLTNNAYQLRERSVDLAAPALWRVLHDAPGLIEGRELQLLDLLEESDRASLLRDEVTENVHPQRQKSALEFLAKNQWSYSRSKGFLQTGGFTEFDEARLRQRLRTQVLPSAVEAGRLPMPLPVLIACQVSLGEYSLDSQSFALRGNLSHCADVQFGTEGRIAQLSGQADASKLPATLSMPMEEAERFVQSLEDDRSMPAGRNRQVLLGIEAMLTGIAASEPDRMGRIDVRFSFETTGAAYYRDGESWSLVRRLDLKRSIPDPADQAPASVELDDGDTLTLLMLRDGLLDPDEELWRTMMSVQSNRQGNDRSTVGWNRYPGGLGGEVGPEDFAEWMRKRAAALPETFVIKGRHSFEPAFGGERGLRVLDAISRHSGIDRGVAAALGFRPDFLLASGVSARWWAPDAARIFVLALPAPKGAYVVPLPPAGAADGTAFDAEVAFRIGKTEVVAADKERRVLVAEAVPLWAKLSVDGQESERTFDADAEAQGGEPRSVPRIPFPDTEWLLLEQARLNGKDLEAGMLEALAGTSFGRRLDEFTLREEALALLQRAQRAAPAGQEGTIWTLGQLKLDTYDFALHRFPVSSLTLAAVPEPPTDLAEQLAKRIGLEVANLDRLSVDMAPESAKAWMSANPKHPSYPIRARGRIAGVGRGGNVRLELLEVDLLAQDAIASIEDPQGVVHEIMLESPAAPSATATSMLTAHAQPAQTAPTEPSAEAIHVEPGELDVLEIRLGDSFEKAVAKAEATVEFPVRADVEQARLAGNAAPAWSAFRTVTTIRSGDGSQVVALHRAPPMVAGQVTGIARVVTFGPERLFPLASVKELLTGKYGEPQEAGERYMVWIPGMADGKAGDDAIRMCVYAMQDRAMQILVSTQLSAAAEASLEVLHNIFGDIGMPMTPQCGEMLVAVLDTNSEGRVKQLVTALGTPSVYAAVESAGQAAEVSAEEKVTPKIKL